MLYFNCKQEFTRTLSTKESKKGKEKEMSKFVTRNQKFTTCKVMVCDTANASVTTKEITLADWYKNDTFTKGTKGFKACQEYSGLGATEIVVAVTEHIQGKQLRIMPVERWLRDSIVPERDLSPDEIAE